MSAPLDKPSLRRQAIERRRALDADMRARASRAIAERVVRHVVAPHVRTILLYASIREEVETHALIERLIHLGLRRRLRPHQATMAVVAAPRDVVERKTFSVLQ